MNKPIIQSLWVGDKLSTFERLSVASFLANGHDFHLYTYTDLANAPKGTHLKDANEIIPEKKIFTYRKGSYAGFADWFRWKLLFKKGNFWVDTDTVCLKPYLFDESIVFGLQSVGSIAVGTVLFPAGHKLCDFLENNCNSPHSFLPYDSLEIKLRKIKRKLLGSKRSSAEWGALGGPEAFTKAIKYFNLIKFAKPPTYFYPVHYSRWNSIFDKTLANGAALFKNSYSIHLWNEMARHCKGFDKNASFPKDSLFEQLKRKYL